MDIKIIRFEKIEIQKINLSGSWIFKNPQYKNIATLTNFVFIQNEQYFLLSGIENINEAIKSSQSIWCAIIEQPTDLDKALINLNSYPVIHEYTLIQAWRYFNNFAKNETELSFIYSQFTTNKKQISELNAWIKLPIIWDNLFLSEQADLSWAPLLSKLSNQDLEKLFPFFNLFKWSKNSGKLFLTNIFELSKIQKTNVNDLITKINLESQLALNLSPKDTLQNIETIIYQERYPHLSKLNQDFKHKVHELSKNILWNIEQNDFFESSSLKISATLKKSDDVLTSLEQLNKITAQLQNLLQGLI